MRPDKKKKEEKSVRDVKGCKSPTEAALSVVRQYDGTDISTDPLGSWTGVPIGEDSMPVQDADDL